jgi:hypothetical protein
MIDLHGGIDPETGRRDIVNPRVMAEMKARRYTDDRQANPSVSVFSSYARGLRETHPFTR